MQYLLLRNGAKSHYAPLVTVSYLFIFFFQFYCGQTQFQYWPCWSPGLQQPPAQEAGGWKLQFHFLWKRTNGQR